MTAQIPRLPRVKFKPMFSVGGLLSGAMGGVGLLVVLQQFSVAAPTRNLAILLAVAGALMGLLGGNVGRLFAVARMNKRLSAVDQRIAAIGTTASAQASPSPAAPLVAPPPGSPR